MGRGKRLIRGLAALLELQMLYLVVRFQADSSRVYASPYVCHIDKYCIVGCYSKMWDLFFFFGVE